MVVRISSEAPLSLPGLPFHVWRVSGRARSSFRLETASAEEKAGQKDGSGSHALRSGLAGDGSPPVPYFQRFFSIENVDFCSVVVRLHRIPVGGWEWPCLSPSSSPSSLPATLVPTAIISLCQMKSSAWIQKNMCRWLSFVSCFYAPKPEVSKPGTLQRGAQRLFLHSRRVSHVDQVEPQCSPLLQESGAPKWRISFPGPPLAERNKKWTGARERLHG